MNTEPKGHLITLVVSLTVPSWKAEQLIVEALKPLREQGVRVDEIHTETPEE